MIPHAKRLFAAALTLAAAACASVALAPSPARTHFWAFTGPWDPRSAASAARHQRQLDVVVSGWIGLDTVSAAPFFRYPDSLTGRSPHTRYMALVTSESNESFRPALIRSLAADPARLGAAAGWIASAGSAGHYAGLVLDFEGHDAADLPALLTVVRAIADSAHAHGVAPVAIAIPATDTVAYPGRGLAGIADALLVMLYDEHWSRSAPGPIASPQWVRQWLATRVREAGADHVVAGFPVYGYRWRPGSDSAAATVGFDEARDLARRSGTRLSAQPGLASLRAKSADGWEIWIPDAASLDTLVAIARTSGVDRVALWRLGLEDPAIWTTGIPRRR